MMAAIFSRLDQFKALRWIWMPALAFTITRLGIAGVAYFSAPILVDSNVQPYHIRPDNVLIDTFASRWDTGFYLSIADEGYRITGNPFPSVPFFPLLPLLIRLGRAITGDSLAAGLLVANLSLFVAMMLLHRLTADETDQATADRAVWYMLIFPTSLFGSAIYTESLFLLWSIVALFLARRGRWGLAGLAGFLAALSRLTGLVVAPMLAVEWLQQRHQSVKQETGSPPRAVPSWLKLACVGLTPLGTLTYMLYLHTRFGDALAFLHAASAWSRTPKSPIGLVGELLVTPSQGWGSAILSGALPLDNWLDLSFVISFLILGVILLLQQRWSEGVFMLLGASLPFSSGLLMSQRRYMWVLFPAFILLARWGRNPWIDRLLWVCFLLGLGLFTALFANWYWVG